MNKIKNPQDNLRNTWEPQNDSFLKRNRKIKKDGKRMLKELIAFLKLYFKT